MIFNYKYFGFILFLILPSCLNWFLEQPSFSLQEIELRRISFQDMELILGWEVRNPNSFDLKLRGLEYAIYLHGEKIGHGHLEKEVLISKSSATKVFLPLRVEIKNLPDPLAFILAGRELPYKIEGVAILKTSLGSTALPFAKSGEVKIRK